MRNFDRAEPKETNSYKAEHAGLIGRSYALLTGRALLSPAPSEPEFAERLYRAPFVVLAHDTADDPIFFYANITAQNLFKMSWDEFVSLPSRYSAEALERTQRHALLTEVEERGFIDNYSGIRIAKTGERFSIDQATVWNLYDLEEVFSGQAATFSHWHPL